MTFVDNSTGAITSAANPVFDYTSRDYVSIIDDLQARTPLYLPEYTSTSNNDFGQVLLQLFAYVGDLLGYYLDRLAAEAFIQTATQAVSIVNLAAMLDYTPHLSTGASGTLQITISSNIAGPIDIPQGTQFSTVASPNQPAIIYETTEDVSIPGAPNAVIMPVQAVQGVTYSNEQVATSDGTINQAYALLNSPISANTDGSPVVTVMVDLGLGPQPWTWLPSLINANSADQAYTTFVDADGTFYIIFGDGVNGRVPQLGSPITAIYQTNSGTLGNVPVNTVTQPVTTIVGVTGVTNTTAMTNGADPESLASIQEKAPTSLRTLERAITPTDFETLAMQVGGVQWASAVLSTYQIVNLYIAPTGNSPTPPSQTLIQAVQAQIAPRVMAQTTLVIPPSPTYVPINIAASVVALPNYGNASVQNAVTAALTNFLAIPNTGFGYRVDVGLVYQIILSVPGVSFANLTALYRGMLAQTLTPITLGNGYTQIGVTPLPEPIDLGDPLVLTDPTGAYVQNGLVASAAAPIGQDFVMVDSFTANANYPADSSIQDVGGVNSAVLLDSEIPVVGVLQINVTGGVSGS